MRKHGSISGMGESVFFSTLPKPTLWPIQPAGKKVKVKCNLVQALRLCTGCTAHRGSRGIALLFNDQRH
jgi:hypothetical protein